jgi:hypothetical protein
VKVPSDYSTNVSRLMSLPGLKVAPDMKSHDYHVLLIHMIIIRIQNILSITVWEAIMNFFLLFNAIGQKVLSELKKALWNFMLSRYVFFTSLF